MDAERKNGTSNLKKALISFAILGAAATVAGLGTFASFTSSTSATHTLASGSVAIALGTPGPANRLNVGAAGLLGGDTVQRATDLVNTGTTGSDDLSAVTLTTTASPSSALDTDVTNGLQMALDKCSVAWTEAGAGPPYTYTCSGTTTAVLASRAIIGTNLALANLASLATGATDHLRVTVTLPLSAPSSLAGLTSTLTYTFTGVQRAATSK
jgi:spore coat-associated protein N